MIQVPHYNKHISRPQLEGPNNRERIDYTPHLSKLWHTFALASTEFITIFNQTHALLAVDKMDSIHVHLITKFVIGRDREQVSAKMFLDHTN